MLHCEIENTRLKRPRGGRERLVFRSCTWAGKSLRCCAAGYPLPTNARQPITSTFMNTYLLCLQRGTQQQYIFHCGPRNWRSRTSIYGMTRMQRRTTTLQHGGWLWLPLCMTDGLFFSEGSIYCFARHTSSHGLSLHYYINMDCYQDFSKSCVTKGLVPA